MTRRARPTLRVLRDDLPDGWDASAGRPGQFDVIGMDAHSPLSALAHPLIRKAVDCFGEDAAQDHPEGRIGSSESVRLWEIKASQWRGAVWVDPAGGTCWLVAAGLAKGGHKDRDDFYKRVERADASGETTRWMPVDEDLRILKREIAATLLVAWELLIQERVLEALRAVAGAGKATFTIPHPSDLEMAFAECAIAFESISGDGMDREELVLEVELDASQLGSNLGWSAILRILIAICPPETGWDRYADTFSTMSEIGALASRSAELEEHVARGELAQSRPNDRAHYAHRKNLADSTVEGLGVRSLCGVFFVPMRDHDSLPHCSVCDERYEKLPA